MNIWRVKILLEGVHNVDIGAAFQFRWPIYSCWMLQVQWRYLYQIKCLMDVLLDAWQYFKFLLLKKLDQWIQELRGYTWHSGNLCRDAWLFSAFPFAEVLTFWRSVRCWAISLSVFRSVTLVMFLMSMMDVFPPLKSMFQTNLPHAKLEEECDRKLVLAFHAGNSFWIFTLEYLIVKLLCLDVTPRIFHRFPTVFGPSPTIATLRPARSWQLDPFMKHPCCTPSNLWTWWESKYEERQTYKQRCTFYMQENHSEGSFRVQS